MSSEIEIEPTILLREFDAPLQLVFDAWTKPEHLKNWQFPFKGFKCEFVSASITPGGVSLHKMTAPNGFEMWLLTKYEEISSGTRLTHIETFSGLITPLFRGQMEKGVPPMLNMMNEALKTWAEK